MNHPTPEPTVPELVFQLEADADVYSVHRALNARFGTRRETAYLWALRRDPSGDVCIVRPASGYAPLELQAGERWLFSLHARVAQKDIESGRRRSYRRGEEGRRLRWLSRRGNEHGFAVVAATVSVVREPVHKPNASFWLDRSEFSGVVEIVEPERVTEAMENGIGGGRAWGLGMLRLIGKQKD